MADDVGAGALPREDGNEAAAGPPDKKTLPPLSMEITEASKTGTSLTYTDYSLIPIDNESNNGDSDENNNFGENFPLKLHRILSRPDLSHAISWLDHGRAWKVHRQDVFASVVIPEYYNHNKYTSFSRQVNGWGFRRIGSGKDHSYYHELFLRGAPHLVRYMRRPGPVPVKAKKDDGREGGGADKKSKIGRRRRTPADRTNEPDFHALDQARPLPRENPPGFDDAVEVAAGAGGSRSSLSAAAPASGGKKKRATAGKKNDDIMKTAIDDAITLSKTLSKNNDVDNNRKYCSAASSPDKKQKKIRKPSLDVDVPVEISSSERIALKDGGVSVRNDGGVGNGMAALLDQQMKLVEMQKRVIAQVQRQQQVHAQGMNVGTGRGLGDKGGNNLQQGHSDRMQRQSQGAASAESMAGMESLPVPAGFGSMAFEPDPLRSDVVDMDISASPALGPKDTTPVHGSDSALDDFDKELDELAGFLGPVDAAMDKDPMASDPLCAWNQNTAVAPFSDSLKVLPQAAEPAPIVPFPSGSMQKDLVPLAHNAHSVGVAGGLQQQQHRQLLENAATIHNTQDPRQRYQMLTMMAQQHQHKGMGYTGT